MEINSVDWTVFDGPFRPGGTRISLTPPLGAEIIFEVTYDSVAWHLSSPFSAPATFYIPSGVVQVRAITTAGLGEMQVIDDGNSPIDGEFSDSLNNIVAREGLWGYGNRSFYYDGEALPDPRRAAVVAFNAAADAQATDYLSPVSTIHRRIVFAAASLNSNSAINGLRMGTTIELLPDAAAAGVRVFEPTDALQTISAEAEISAGVIDIFSRS